MLIVSKVLDFFNKNVILAHYLTFLDIFAILVSKLLKTFFAKIFEFQCFAHAL